MTGRTGAGWDRRPTPLSATPYLRSEVVLLQLPALPQIPGADGVVKAACPEFSAIVGYVDAAGAVRVALELPAIQSRNHTHIYRHAPRKTTGRIEACSLPPLRPDERLVVQVPDGDVPVAAAGEADFGVGADGQGVAGRGRGGELGLDARRLGGQVPDGQRAGLAPDDQCAAVRQQLAGADVVIPVLVRGEDRENQCVFGAVEPERFGNESLAERRKIITGPNCGTFASREEI